MPAEHQDVAARKPPVQCRLNCLGNGACPGGSWQSVQMPYTLFGVGTEFIGKRDFGSDGAYVSTEFKTAMLPLYPTRSVRVIEGKSSIDRHLISRTLHTEYSILAEGKVNVRQAAYVYGYALFHVTYLFALASAGPKWLMEESSIVNPKWILQFAVFALPGVIPFTMRLIGRRRTSALFSAICPCGSGLPFRSCCQARWEELKNRERNFHRTIT